MSATAFDRVHDGRIAFRAALAATCDPGAVVPLPCAGVVADPALDRACAVLLALLDPGFGLAAVGDAAVGEACSALRALTGAGPAPEADADFVLVGAGARAGVATRARRGTALAPEQGATVVYAGRWAPVGLRLDGPGLAAPRAARLCLPPGEANALAASRVEAPLGVDAFVVSAGGVAALPRSVEVSA